MKSREAAAAKQAVGDEDDEKTPRPRKKRKQRGLDPVKTTARNLQTQFKLKSRGGELPEGTATPIAMVIVAEVSKLSASERNGKQAVNLRRDMARRVQQLKPLVGDALKKEVQIILLGLTRGYKQRLSDDERLIVREGVLQLAALFAKIRVDLAAS